MGVLATDDFNRADAANLGANWADAKGATGELSILSNQCAYPDTIDDRHGQQYSAITWPDDHYSQAATVNINAGATALMVRAITSGTQRNHYGGGNFPGEYGAGTNYELWKWVANVLTDLGTGATGAAGGQTWYLSAVGTTIDLKVGGVSKVSATDASHASGQPGLYAQGTANQAIFDNWEGGGFITSGKSLPLLGVG